MKMYIVDAFTDVVFKGNPAAVCVLDAWLPEETMQNIAIENNLSETAFLVKEGEVWHIRWFTPGGEVDLCGHATLGSSYVLSRFYEPDAEVFEFTSLSGPLTVQRKGELFEMDFPSRMPEPVEFTPAMKEAIHGLDAKAYLSRDVMLVLERKEDVIGFEPDYTAIAAVPEGMGLFLTAPSKDERYDFVCRTFFPKIKVNEDPVCGSAHCNLIPYWADRLGKKTLTSFQASPRSGVVYCEDNGDRVLISGNVVLYSEATIHI